MLLSSNNKDANNSHFKFGRFESRGVMLNATTTSFPHLFPRRGIRHCSSTAGLQLLLCSWPTWAPDTAGGGHLQHTKSHSTALGTRTKGAEGQSATTPGCLPLQHPKSKPWASNNPPQPASHTYSRGSQPLQCPGCWLGAAWQAQGFPLSPLPGCWTHSAIAHQLVEEKPPSMRPMVSEIRLLGFSAHCSWVPHNPNWVWANKSTTGQKPFKSMSLKVMQKSPIFSICMLHCVE